LSPSDEVREEGSLVSHPQRIKSHVEYKNSQEPGWGEIVEVYTDKDYSGKDTNRPAFRRMLQDIKLGRINAVIFTELSRISRDVKDFCNFWEFLKAHKATFVSLKENFDTTTPIGEMMVIQAISFAQFERKTIVQRIKDGARARAERGLANGGINLLGFERHPHKRGTLLVNEDEAVIVRHIFGKFLELGTVAKTREYLNQNGYRTKSYVTKDGRQRGGQIWTLATLHSLLTNIRVIGKVEVNAQNKDVEADQLNRMEQYRQVDASWPAIVEPAVFAAVQDKLCHNGRFAKRHIHHYRLSGLVECGLCGKELAGQSANGTGGKYFYYGHSRKHSIASSHLDRCPLERMPAVRLEEAVSGRLMELAGSHKLLAQLAKDSQVDTTGVNQEIEKLLASKEQEKRKLDRMIDNLIESLADLPEGMAPKSILEKVADLEWQRDQILSSMNDLREEKRNKGAKVINMEHVFKVFRLFNRDFPKRPAHEQREILRSVIQKIVVQENGIRVFYFGSPNDDKVAADLDRDIESKLRVFSLEWGVLTPE
jgi:site-specific DNA recombinase